MSKEMIKTLAHTPVTLIGLMGAGKTSVGSRLAKKLHRPFADSDQVIEERTGISISEIFELKGEAYFRKLEHDTIALLIAERPALVLATGGGAFMQDKTRSLIKEDSISVWIRAELDILLERVSRKKTRPLLEQGDKREILESLMNVRYPVYAEADIMVESTDETHESVVQKILNALKDYE